MQAKPINFAKYLLPSSFSEQTSLSSATAIILASDSQMPALRFRDYVCEGMSKDDDDRVAQTSSSYLRLELAQALTEDYQLVEEALRPRQIKIPQ
jgi:hypothetical protein